MGTDFRVQVWVRVDWALIWGYELIIQHDLVTGLGYEVTRVRIDLGSVFWVRVDLIINKNKYTSLLGHWLLGTSWLWVRGDLGTEF